MWLYVEYGNTVVEGRMDGWMDDPFPPPPLPKKKVCDELYSSVCHELFLTVVFFCRDVGLMGLGVGLCVPFEGGKLLRTTYTDL